MMLRTINFIKDPPPELAYILWRWLPTLDIWETIDGRMYIKNASQWHNWRNKVEPICSIAIYIDKKHLRVPRRAATFSSDPSFEFHVSGCCAEISPHYVSRQPCSDNPVAKVDFTDPNALDQFYKLIKRVVGKILNPEKGL